MAGPLYPYNYRKLANSNIWDDYRVNQAVPNNAGKWSKSVSVSNATVYFTGSNYGAGAIMLTATTNGTASLTGGGTINLSLLSADTIYEFSVIDVKEDSGNVVYVLMNQG